MSLTDTCGCGAVFEDEEMIELFVKCDHNLDLEAFEWGCGQVVDDPETVELSTNERDLF